MFIGRPGAPSLLAAGLFVAAAITAAAPAPVEACGMRYSPVVRPADTERYLAAALRHLEKGEVDLAVFQARRVLKVARISDRQRAQALTVSSWAAWQRGEHPAAVASLRRARALDADGAIVEAVLARASDRALTAALRRAAVG